MTQMNKSRNRLTDMENRLVVARGERELRRRDWEFGISRCKLSYTHIYIYTYAYAYTYGLPGGSVVKNPPPVQERQDIRVGSLGQSTEEPLEEEMATPPVFLTGESLKQRSLAGYSPQGSKESDMTERLSTYAHKCPHMCCVWVHACAHVCVCLRYTVSFSFSALRS